MEKSQKNYLAFYLKMREYTVKIKDYEQNITHTIKQMANSKNEANYMALKWLVKKLGHHNLEVL